MLTPFVYEEMLPGFPKSWVRRRSGATAVLRNGHTIVMGGILNGLDFNDVWRSVDHGATWTIVNANAPWTPRYAAAATETPSGGVLLCGGYAKATLSSFGDCWLSPDEGFTWQLQMTSAMWIRVHDHALVTLWPTGAILLLAGTSSSVYRSTDDGQTWQDLQVDALFTRRQSAAVTATAEGVVMVVGGNLGAAEGYSEDVWTCSDGGSTWVQRASSLPRGPVLQSALVHLYGDTFILAGGWTIENDALIEYRATLMVTHDMGSTWTVLGDTQFDARPFLTSQFVPVYDPARGGAFILMVSAFALDVWRVWMPLGPGGGTAAGAGLVPLPMWAPVPCDEGLPAICGAPPSTMVSVSVDAGLGPSEPPIGSPSPDTPSSVGVVYAPPRPAMALAASQASVSPVHTLQASVEFSAPVSGLTADDFRVASLDNDVPLLVAQRWLDGSGASYVLHVALGDNSHLLTSVCPFGYTPSALSKLCMRYEASPATWSHQQRSCAPYTLAVATTVEDLEAAYGVMASSAGAWIGAHSAGPTRESGFRTADGSPNSTFSPWMPGHPFGTNRCVYLRPTCT